MDRQFLSLRRHRPPPPPRRRRPKIQFEKSNNAAQFARKCASRSSSGGHCPPDGHNAPDWRGTRSPPRPSRCPPPPPRRRRRPPFHMAVLFVSLQLFFPPGRRFGRTRAADIIVGALPRSPICIPRSKSGRPGSPIPAVRSRSALFSLPRARERLPSSRHASPIYKVWKLCHVPER